MIEEKSTDIVGHMTMADGSHVPLTREEGAAIWAQVEKAQAARLAMMPDVLSAIQVLNDARTRLSDEGWRDGIYCPKDGSEFALIQFGSTGIFEGFYSGSWPDGHVISCDCVSRPEGMLWKAVDKLTSAERERLERCMATDKVMHERELRAFGALSPHGEGE